MTPVLSPFFPLLLFSNGEQLEDAELQGDPQSMFLTNLHGYLHGQIPFCRISCRLCLTKQTCRDKEFPFSSSREDPIELFRSKYRKIRGDDDFAPRCTSVKSGEPNGASPPPKVITVSDRVPRIALSSISSTWAP
jgi:hypothetical protein